MTPALYPFKLTHLFLYMLQSPLGLPLTMEEKEDNLSDQEPDQEAVQR